MEKTTMIYSIELKDSDILAQQPNLVTLYQPIIGSSAVGLYHSLFNEYKTLRKLKLKLETPRLNKISGLTEKQFADDLKKLESLRLVKTLVSKNGKSIIYQIFAPLDIEEFFNNAMFEQALTKKIGLENLEIIKFTNQEVVSKNINESEYDEVTAIFEDVFADEIDEMENTPTLRETMVVQFKHKKNSLFDKFINVEILNKILIENNVALDLKSRRNQKLFVEALTKQNFTEKTLAKLITSAFNFETAKIETEIFYKNLNSLIAKKLKKDIKGMENNLTAEQIEYVNLMENLTPEEYIFEMAHHLADYATRKMIAILQEKYALLNGPINCMIQHSIHKNNKIVPNYIYKIADSLNTYSINKTVDVLSYLNFFQKENNEHSEELVPINWTKTDEELIALFE
ncbi:hypothetical protein [Williamsoniiplasma lucivorax]|uniref:Chromosome replication initiation and membrane attachment protein n=1 Tax=Williamsoniiplasma lucivorax TaxID=209274 RepID=A0A2S5RFQ5_9MOLU|nr:hypothetical protein [Williamsoniiplasma lucivorax]PPE06143.1 chromosome replication initiation and membrane attachment protein [Williamsoniiplasma lucivorax]